MSLRMDGAEKVIFDELKTPGITQDSIATTYYFLLLDYNDGKEPPWAEINAAIQAKWPGTALRRIKEKAWKLMDKYLANLDALGAAK